MAVVAPFKGMTYNLNKITHFERVVTPPYDVISEREQDEYYEIDPYNVIRLILGKRKIGDSDWDNRYTRAADLFNRWESGGILTRSQLPCIYLVSTEYELPDHSERRTRWGFIALVKIEEHDSSVIRPHERTFTVHREDRLKLMRACSAQFSPVFGLYDDRPNAVLSTLEEIKGSPPKISFREKNGYCYRMWEVNKAPIISAIVREMSAKPIIIADGHHRYESARNFRNLMRSRYGVHELERPYDYVMMYLTNMADKGLAILPYHRLFKSYPDFRAEQLPSAARKWFDVRSFPFSENDQKEATKGFLSQLRAFGGDTTAIGFYYNGSRDFYLLCLKPGAREELGDDLHPALKKLDVLALSRLVFQRIMGIRREDLDDERIIQYESDTGLTLSSVLSGKAQMAFLVNPTKIEQIIEVTGNALLMPRKSTFFHPKILTGLVFNKIDPHDIIQIPESRG
jgi:uncharacterized protein (DUF1015 family)